MTTQEIEELKTESNSDFEEEHENRFVLKFSIRYQSKSLSSLKKNSSIRSAKSIPEEFRNSKNKERPTSSYRDDTTIDESITTMQSIKPDTLKNNVTKSPDNKRKGAINSNTQTIFKEISQEKSDTDLPARHPVAETKEPEQQNKLSQDKINSFENTQLCVDKNDSYVELNSKNEQPDAPAKRSTSIRNGLLFNAPISNNLPHHKSNDDLNKLNNDKTNQVVTFESKSNSESPGHRRSNSFGGVINLKNFVDSYYDLSMQPNHELADKNVQDMNDSVDLAELSPSDLRKNIQKFDAQSISSVNRDDIAPHIELNNPILELKEFPMNDDDSDKSDKEREKILSPSYSTKSLIMFLDNKSDDKNEENMPKEFQNHRATNFLKKNDKKKLIKTPEKIDESAHEQALADMQFRPINTNPELELRTLDSKHETEMISTNLTSIRQRRDGGNNKIFKHQQYENAIAIGENEMSSSNNTYEYDLHVINILIFLGFNILNRVGQRGS